MPGIVLACVSLMALPLLAGAKRRVARGLESAAILADAKQSEFCARLSAILLAGLILNAAFGLWWADPVAALLMVPLIAREGIESLRRTLLMFAPGDSCWHLFLLFPASHNVEVAPSHEFLRGHHPGT